ITLRLPDLTLFPYTTLFRSRPDLAGETLNHLSAAVHHILGEVPARLLTLAVNFPEHRVGLLAGNRRGRNHGEGHPEIYEADLGRFFLGVRLLAKIITGKTDHHQAPVFILLVQRLQPFKLTGITATAGGIN